VIVQLAGLPGSGKSALAAELVHRLGASALLLDKGHVRCALFGVVHTLYTREQDDFCVTMMLRTAAWHLRRASRIREPLRLIECICADAIIEERLCADEANGTHPAANRDIQLYRQLRAGADPIPDPKFRLDTAQHLRKCADRALSYLNHALPTDPTRCAPLEAAKKRNT
jgi:hypothetical protein